MKKLLAILLACVLALSFALPSMAMEDTLPEELIPAVPVITEQPEGLRVCRGEAFTLRVAANVPNGDAIGYRWYRYLQQEVGSEQSLRLTADENTAGYYYVEVYNLDNPEVPAVTSNHVFVEVLEKRSIWGSIKSFFQNALGYLFFFGYMALFFIAGLLLAPIHWIGGLFN